MPEETAVTPEQADAQFTAELAAMMKSEETATPPEGAAEDTPPEVAVSPPPVESSEEKPPEVAPEPTLEEKLAKIEEPVVPKAEAPQLAPDQQKILAAIPTIQVAQEMATAAESYRQLDTAIASGDFDKVEQMFAPQALESLKEHLYQKNIAQWIERWVSEKEGNPVVNQGIKNLERQIADLRGQREAEDRQRQQSAHQQKIAEVGRQYDTHIKQLFDMIEFAEGDRRWVRAAIDKLVGEDKNALRSINSGQISAINPLFKQAVKEYVQRDQTTTQTKDAQKELQAKHKPLVSGTAVTPVSDTVTDEMIRSAPAAQRDALIEKQFEQGLAKLFSPKKK